MGSSGTTHQAMGGSELQALLGEHFLDQAPLGIAVAPVLVTSIPQNIQSLYYVPRLCSPNGLLQRVSLGAKHSSGLLMSLEGLEMRTLIGVFSKALCVI